MRQASTRWKFHFFAQNPKNWQNHDLYSFLFGTEVMMCQKNREGWLVGVWDGDRWDPSHPFRISSHSHPTRRCTVILPFFGLLAFPCETESTQVMMQAMSLTSVTRRDGTTGVEVGLCLVCHSDDKVDASLGWHPATSSWWFWEYPVQPGQAADGGRRHGRCR